jgi:hypothetical protein
VCGVGCLLGGWVATRWIACWPASWPAGELAGGWVFVGTGELGGGFAEQELRGRELRVRLSCVLYLFCGPVRGLVAGAITRETDGQRHIRMHFLCLYSSCLGREDVDVLHWRCSTWKMFYVEDALRGRCSTLKILYVEHAPH